MFGCAETIQISIESVFTRLFLLSFFNEIIIPATCFLFFALRFLQDKCKYLSPIISIRTGLYCLTKISALEQVDDLDAFAQTMSIFVSQLLCHFFFIPQATLLSGPATSSQVVSSAEAELFVIEMATGFEVVQEVMSGSHVNWKLACPPFSLCVALLRDILRNGPFRGGTEGNGSSERDLHQCLKFWNEVRIAIENLDIKKYSAVFHYMQVKLFVLAWPKPTNT